MTVVSLTNEERKVYGTFFKLRKSLPNVKIITLRQISVYIGKTVDKVDNFSINEIDNNNYEIILDDGRKIIFDGNTFGFLISKNENGILMDIKVYEEKHGDPSSVMVYGVVDSFSNGTYIVNSVSNDCAHFGNINYYDSNLNMFNFEFNINSETDSSFDCFDGCLGDFLARIDLLYNNLKCVIDSSKVKRRSVC